MHRRRGRASALALTAVSVVGLAACDKPLEKVTVLAGKKTTVISAFHGTQKDVCTGSKSIPTINATRGSTILVDVPKKVADNGWLVSAFTADASCNLAPLPIPASSDVTNSHTLRLTVPIQGQGGYFVMVVPVTGSSLKSSWVVQVNLAQ